MEDIRTFRSNIEKKYQERRINCEEQWPPCHSNKLVRLDIVEREKGVGYSANLQRGREDNGVKLAPIAYSDLFKEESGKRPVTRKVLVEGGAGIGKTTLCISISEDWANGKLFQQFKLVLLLPLRMKVVASAGSLPELLKLLHSSTRLCDSVARYLEEKDGESVLIIADGWDELSESKRQKGSFLFQLLIQRFPLMSVVLTSRPSASAPLHLLPYIDRFVEVRGFSKEHIVEFIQSEFASDQEKRGRLFEQLPLVESVCSVPLNCAIVCHLWHTLEEALPTTMTELYTKIILQLILRNIRKIDAYNSVLSLPNFNALPPDLQQSWWLLCKFAFQALEKDQLVFSQIELKVFFPEGFALDKRILCFGLLQPAESIGFGISFHFLRLTFQEYLAALHLARQSPNKQLDFFKSHKPRGRYFPNRFIMVEKFFFGITRFEISNADIIQQMFECVAGKYDSNILPICHCAFEAHNDLISDQLTQYIVSHPSFLYGINFGYPRTAHDCTAVLFVIANLQECVIMWINFANCDVREYQVKKFIDILALKKGKLQIVNLILSGSRLTVSGLQALEGAVRSDLLTKLMNLNLSGSLTSDAGTNAAWLTTFIEALSAHCPHLKSLDLSDNNLGVPGASAISNIYSTATCDEPSDRKHKSTSIVLYLNKTNLGDEGLTTIIKNLKAGAVTFFLSLVKNNIHAFGVTQLADAVCSGIFMLDDHEYDLLDLSDNPLELEGSIAIGKIISSSHCQFFRVFLSRCELTTALPNTDPLNLGSYGTVSSEAMKDIGQQLCQMPQSCHIYALELNGNSFTREGIHILAGFIHLCPCITNLYTNDCGITSDDLIQLLDRLTQLKCSSPNLCNELKSWSLRNNLIDDSGVSALIDRLPSLFPHLQCEDYSYISLDDNPVSSEMKKRLEDEIKKCEEVSHSVSQVVYIVLC